MRDGKLDFFAALASFALVVAALYLGRAILIPLALAILLTFILSPLVLRLRHWHLRHGLAVAIIVILAFSVLGMVLTGIGRQVNSLAIELPDHKENIRDKIRDLRGTFQNAAFDRVKQVFRELRWEFEADDPAPPGSTNNITITNSAAAPSAPPAQSAQSAASPAPPAPPPDDETDEPSLLTRMFGPVSSFMVSAGFVIALVLFMLLRRDELRNRLILLGGLEQLPVTTRILSEAGERISRYLLTYSMLNAIYGVAIGIGLHVVGLPYALLWGFFAAVMRFIPYLGPWIGAALPVLLSLAVFPGWVQPLLVVALYVVVELTSNLLLEPIFYGQSAGVSEVALLVALAFWMTVWGPVGLLLGTPLTVCLVVLAKYIPALEWFHLLFGDGPLQEKCLIYYEHLRAHNDEGAETMVRDQLKDSPPLAVFDQLLLPALIFARRDRRRSLLRAATERRIIEAVRKAIELTADSGETQTTPTPTEKHLVGIPAGEESEELALLMLKRSLRETGIELDVQRCGSSPENCAAAAAQKNLRAICVGALPPDAAKRIQTITAALRDKQVAAPVITGEWGIGGQMDGRLTRALGGKYAGGTLAGTRNAILRALENPEAAQG